MATITRSNNDNFLTWNKITGTLSPEDLQANGLNKVNAPQNLAVSSFVLTWNDKSNFETGVEIHRRSESEIRFTKIAEVGANVETYTDTNAGFGIVYYYKVRAYYDNGVGNKEVGLFSNEVNDTFDLVWISRTAAEQNPWRDIDYNGSDTFMAVTNSGFNQTMISSDNGSTWTSVGGIASSGLCIAYGGGFWITSGSGININRSNDNGSNWSSVIKPETNTWADIKYGNNTFVSISSNGTNRSAWSDDLGLTWNDVFVLANTYVGLAFGDSKFVGLSATGANRIIISSDNGQSWTSATPGLNNWRDIEYGGGKFVIVSSGGDIEYSTDATTWNIATPPITGVFNSIKYGNGLFVIVMSISASTLVSKDGINWFEAIAEDANLWTGLSYGDNTFVAISSDGTNRVMTATV